MKNLNKLNVLFSIMALFGASLASAGCVRYCLGGYYDLDRGEFVCNAGYDWYCGSQADVQSFEDGASSKNSSSSTESSNDAISN